MHILLLLTWANFFAGDMMCKVNYLHLEEGTFGWFQLKVKLSETLKDHM